MKIPLRQKIVLLTSLAALYMTGVLTWVLSNWFFVVSSFGSEPTPMRTFWLHMHGVVSLWFLAFFGFVFHAHVIPAWRRGLKRLTGSLLTCVLIFLSVTVPGLYYIVDEGAKDWIAFAHTYVGLAALAFFGLHYFSKRT